MGRHNSFGTGLRVYNLDETGTMTVQSFQKVLTPKGAKQVSKVISAERGTLVTTCCIVGASGQAVPPALIFPRAHYKTHMINGAPVGTLGLATKGGWMNSEKFVEVINILLSTHNLLLKLRLFLSWTTIKATSALKP